MLLHHYRHRITPNANRRPVLRPNQFSHPGQGGTKGALPPWFYPPTGTAGWLMGSMAGDGGMVGFGGLAGVGGGLAG